jgi:hypothetical protein
VREKWGVNHPLDARIHLFLFDEFLPVGILKPALGLNRPPARLAEQRVRRPYPEACLVQKYFGGGELQRYQQWKGYQVDIVNAATDGKVAECAEKDETVDATVKIQGGV